MKSYSNDLLTQKKCKILFEIVGNTKLIPTFSTAKRTRKGAGVVDRAALEMRCTGNCTGGSNPSLSAQSSRDTALFFCGGKRGIRSVGGGVAELSASCEIDIVATQLR